MERVVVTEERPYPVLGHRPALDGLRGVAVLMVLAGHIPPLRVERGATVGVTLFFVLSGFLITLLLLQEVRRAGSLHFGRFYARRALRLLPALALMLTVVGVYAAITEDVSAPVLYPLLYAADFVMAASRDIGVFDHTWSLSLEEQFYLVWPVVFVVAFRRGWRIAAAVAGVGVAISLMANVVLISAGAEGEHWERVNFAPDTRAYALLLGCLAAVVLPELLGRRASRLAVGPAIVCCALASVLGDKSAVLYLVALPAVALAGVVIIIGLFEESAPPLQKIFTWAPLTFTGRISYGLYLWHFPTYAIVGQHLGDMSWQQAAAILVAATFAVATVSYFAVERGFLNLKRRFAVPRDSLPAPA